MPNRAHVSRARHKPKPVHKRDQKHYWPYLPMLALVLAIFAVNLFQPLQQHGVLAYATEMSHGSLLSATNAQRGQNGKSALALNSSLSKAAQSKANDMVSRDYWAHNTPDGKEPWVFIDTTGYDYQKAGENLAYGFSTSSATVSGWMNSASHKANMLDGTFSEVGFGFANSSDFNDNGKQTVVVAMYAKPQVLSAGSNAEVTSPKPKTETQATAPAPKPVAKTTKKAEVVSNTEINTAAPAFSTDHAGLEPITQSVARLDTITNGEAQWALFALGMLTGVSLAVLLIKHAVSLRHLLRDSERLILHHPLLDTAILSLILVGSFLLQTGGYIR